MPTKVETPPPSHLSEESSQWWESVCEQYALEGHHLRLLRLACECWDRAQQARRALKRDGLFFTDRFGQPRTHPAADVERQNRNQFRLLVRELALDVEPPPEARRLPRDGTYDV